MKIHSLEEITDWVCSKRYGTKAFQGWDDDLIGVLIRKTWTNKYPVKWIIRIEKGHIEGFLLIKEFEDERRIHVSQVLANNTKVFFRLMKCLYEKYPDWIMSSERRMKPKIYNNYERMLRLIKRFSERI